MRREAGVGGEAGVVEVSLSVFLRRLLVLFFLPFLLIACAQQKFYVNEVELQQKWLPFLEEGKIKKQAVMSKVGIPHRKYEHGRIWMYRMELPENGPLEASPVGQYNLVLIFDENDTLTKYSLLRFKP